MDLKRLLNKFGFAALFLIITWGFWKILLSTNCYWFAHDLLMVLQRMAVTERCILEGQFYPRWSGELYGGYGYPLLQFYPPLFSMLGAGLKIAGMSILNAMKLLVMIAICTSGWFSYLWLKTHGNRVSALTGAIAFTCFPYHVIVLKVRGAVSELLAMSLFPMILYFLDRIITRGRRRDVILCALGYAALMVAHNASFLFFVPGSLVYLLVMSRSDRRIASGIQTAIALTTGMGLTAFYWIPAILEKKFVQIDSLVNSVNVNYRDHLVSVSDIFNREWGFGGLGWLLLGAVAAAFLLFGIRSARTRYPHLIWLMPTMAVIYIFMTSQPSQFFWDHLPLLQLIGYPFRLFGPAGLFAAACLFLVMETLSDLSPAAERVFRPVIFLVVIGVTVSSPLMQHVVHPHEFNERYLMSEDGIRKSTSSTVVADEYAPVWVIKKPYEDHGIAFEPTQHFPRGDVAVEMNRSHAKEMVVWADDSGTLRLNTIFFPGWTVSLDDQPANIRYDNPYGLMDLEIPGGAHKVTMEFKATPVRMIAMVISWMTFLGLLILTIIYWKPRSVVGSR